MLNGGRANTDFIDNAGGVDCSDKEVNIKILLNAIVADGDMTIKQRNTLLAKMTNEVSSIVLADNYLQIQSISITEQRSEYTLKEYMRFIHHLEKEGRIDRKLEFIPEDDVLLERKSTGQGLTRAELSVLTAYGKMVLKEELLVPEVNKNPYFKNTLINYFPKPLGEKYASQMQKHRLRNEIIATELANAMVDYMGSNFAYRIKDETGASFSEIACCFSMAMEIFGIKSMLNLTDNTESPELRLENWMNENADLVQRWQTMVADFKSTNAHEFAKFSVALRELLLLVQACIKMSM